MISKSKAIFSAFTLFLSASLSAWELPEERLPIAPLEGVTKASSYRMGYRTGYFEWNIGQNSASTISKLNWNALQIAEVCAEMTKVVPHQREDTYSFSLGYIAWGLCNDRDYDTGRDGRLWLWSVSQVDGLFAQGTAKRAYLKRCKHWGSWDFLPALGADYHGCYLRQTDGRLRNYGGIPLRRYGDHGVDTRYYSLWISEWLGGILRTNLNSRSFFSIESGAHLASHFGIGDWVLRDDLEGFFQMSSGFGTHLAICYRLQISNHWTFDANLKSTCLYCPRGFELLLESPRGTSLGSVNRTIWLDGVFQLALSCHW